MTTLMLMILLLGAGPRPHTPNTEAGVTLCKTDKQCALRQICERGKCQAGCYTHADCPDLENCAPLRDCRPGDAKCPKFCHELKTVETK
jgi:hypothetical protein